MMIANSVVSILSAIVFVTMLQASLSLSALLLTDAATAATSSCNSRHFSGGIFFCCLCNCSSRPSCCGKESESKSEQMPMQDDFEGYLHPPSHCSERFIPTPP